MGFSFQNHLGGEYLRLVGYKQETLTDAWRAKTLYDAPVSSAPCSSVVDVIVQSKA